MTIHVPRAVVLSRSPLLLRQKAKDGAVAQHVARARAALRITPEKSNNAIIGEPSSPRLTRGFVCQWKSSVVEILGYSAFSSFVLLF